jgi:hypothetical protein
MLNTRILRRGALAATGALIIAFAAAFAASDIVEDWDSVKPPPKPELKAVTLDPSTTALLILDMSKDGACKTRPRCIATIPNVKRLHDAARAAGVMLWYSIGGTSEPAEMIGPGFTPHDGEWAHQPGPDKFLGSNLEEKLKGHAIKTVVVCGTSFQGVVRGYVHGAIFVVAFLQGRTCRGHKQFNADPQHDGEVRKLRTSSISREATSKRDQGGLPSPPFPS